MTNENNNGNGKLRDYNGSNGHEYYSRGYRDAKTINLQILGLCVFCGLMAGFGIGFLIGRSKTYDQGWKACNTEIKNLIERAK